MTAPRASGWFHRASRVSVRENVARVAGVPGRAGVHRTNLRSFTNLTLAEKKKAWWKKNVDRPKKKLTETKELKGQQTDQ